MAWLETLAMVLVCAIALLRAVTLWWPDIRRLWDRRNRRPVRKVPSVPFTFRHVSYVARSSSDGTAVWQRRAEAPSDVAEGQPELAKQTFDILGDVLLDASVRLLKSHAAWFEDEAQRTTAGQLASELDVESVSVAPDLRDTTVYARHAAFSGHILEIRLARGRRVTHVDLLG